jgi:hypothetical protein
MKYNFKTFKNLAYKNFKVTVFKAAHFSKKISLVAATKSALSQCQNSHNKRKIASKIK